MFFALVVGQLPFAAHTERELYKKIQQGIYHLPTSTSRVVKEVLGRMLQVDPAKRASAKEIVRMVGGGEKVGVKRGEIEERMRMEAYERHMR